jgi:hypothetical protein
MWNTNRNFNLCMYVGARVLLARARALQDYYAVGAGTQHANAHPWHWGACGVTIQELRGPSWHRAYILFSYIYNLSQQLHAHDIICIDGWPLPEAVLTTLFSFFLWISISHLSIEFLKDSNGSASLLCFTSLVRPQEMELWFLTLTPQ